MKTTQRHIRQLIAEGAAVDANKLGDSDLEDLAAHHERLAVSFGVNGMNGGVCRDTRTGQLYAVPSRSSALFILF